MITSWYNWDCSKEMNVWEMTVRTNRCSLPERGLQHRCCSVTSHSNTQFTLNKESVKNWIWWQTSSHYLSSKSCNLFLEFSWDFLKDVRFILQASDTISVSSNPEGVVQLIKSPKQRLPSGSQPLIKWAGDHGYNPVTSYTNTPVANHFSIQLRESGMVNSTTDLSLTPRE